MEKVFLKFMNGEELNDEELDFFDELVETQEYTSYMVTNLFKLVLETDNLYQKLDYLDSAILMLRDELIDEDAFTDDYIVDLLASEKGELYVLMVITHMKILITIGYGYQAFSDYGELKILDTMSLFDLDSFGMLIALNIDNMDLAKDIYDSNQSHNLNIDFPYAVLLHAHGMSDMALKILKSHYESQPFFKEIINNLIAGKDFSDTLPGTADEFLFTLRNSIDFLEYGLIELLGETLH